MSFSWPPVLEAVFKHIAEVQGRSRHIWKLKRTPNMSVGLVIGSLVQLLQKSGRSRRFVLSS